MPIKHARMMILLGLVFLFCAGCQGFSFDLNSESAIDSYLDTKLFDQVPSVKDLLLDERVQAYLQKQPYIYGRSMDGRTLAILSYVGQKQSCRLDFYRLSTGESIQTLYLPSQAELEARMHSENGDEILEYIGIVQETVERGYQIKRPVKPILLVPQTRYILNKDKGWYVRPVQEEGHFHLTIENSRGEHWTIFRQDLGKIGPEQVFAYLLPFDENNSVWTFVVFMMGENAETNVVQHFDDKTLSSVPFDQELEQVCNRMLAEGKKDCRLAFRHEEQDHWYLLVKGKQKERNDSRISYQGRVGQFLILNDKKEVLIKGTRQNLISAGKTFRFSRQFHGYRVHLSKTGQESAEKIVIDVLDHKQQVMQTIVLRWNDRQKQFQQMEEN
ncbi:hypothetical protein [Thermoactinomyces mirandus]|uniref:Uncharacterized protein n=1 Tax=Thermoactinomyces mirandus TaxID=2756294 RepID=A0A7W2AQF1_9BACL|nr:hypothetical protein [Thermoactinomyces mirandus]MBA4601448.1 hypothetical protein [Thermoactinomyces mirandus]